MTRQFFKFVAITGVLVLLASCTADDSGKTRILAASDMLAQVRLAGQVGAELDVQPLRDPQVEDLRASALAAEARGDMPAAELAIAKALTLATQDTDLLQWRAELALYARDWPLAEQLARRSFELGPKLGGLCRRNWTTIAFVQEVRSDVAGALLSRQRVADCAIKPPVRM